MDAKETEHVRSLLTATYLLQGMLLARATPADHKNLRKLYKQIDRKAVQLGFRDGNTRYYVPKPVKKRAVKRKPTT